jgi:hypothetical protein
MAKGNGLALINRAGNLSPRHYEVAEFSQLQTS